MAYTDYSGATKHNAQVCYKNTWLFEYDEKEDPDDEESEPLALTGRTFELQVSRGNGTPLKTVAGTLSDDDTIVNFKLQQSLARGVYNYVINQTEDDVLLTRVYGRLKIV